MLIVFIILIVFIRHPFHKEINFYFFNYSLLLAVYNNYAGTQR